MFKRNDILKLGGYRTFFENAEDYDLWLRVRDSGSVVSVLEPLTFYRVHPGQISTVQMKQRVFGSYSARLNNFLEKKNMGNLISRYGSFEKWNSSFEGRIILRYVSFRLMASREIKKFEKGEFEGSRLENFIIGKVFLSLKSWRRGSKS
jgi:GT2 family glycosyltransferase